MGKSRETMLQAQIFDGRWWQADNEQIMRMEISNIDCGFIVAGSTHHTYSLKRGVQRALNCEICKSRSAHVARD